MLLRNKRLSNYISIMNPKNIHTCHPEKKTHSNLYPPNFSFEAALFAKVYPKGIFVPEEICQNLTFFVCLVSELRNNIKAFSFFKKDLALEKQIYCSH